MQHGHQLPLDRCPHCNVAKPLLQMVWQGETIDHTGFYKYLWANYVCRSCGQVTLAMSQGEVNFIVQIWPKSTIVDDSIPERARAYLSQAIASISAPAGAVMLAASAIDSMLKDKDYKDGTLYSRIESAAKNHLITDEMAAWAHDIRLDANDQRHADENAILPNNLDATKAIEFANALAQFLYVLPARVERGRKTNNATP
jgi:uncharacterized protein (UPF0147 family)